MGEPLENSDNLHGLKILDFNDAHVMREGLRLQMQHGDLLHRAPEIFDNDYGFGVDVWSAGITMYRVVTGALPFKSEEQICNYPLERLVEEAAGGIGGKKRGARAAKLPFHLEVVTQLLEKRERERPTAAVALEMMQTGRTPKAMSRASQATTMPPRTSQRFTQVTQGSPLSSTVSEEKFGALGSK